MSLCLGHACVGSFSCFAEGTEAIDSHGEGFCKEHADFISETLPNGAICFAADCRHLIETEDSSTGYMWGPANPDCYRCNGMGIDPVCKSNKEV